MPMEDPNSPGVIVPTPKEIADGCRKIQKRWDRVQEQGHRNWTVQSSKKGIYHPHVGGQDQPYEIPEILDS